MDGITDENNANLRFFTIAGERVACNFTEENFLGCPETKKLLVDEEETLFSKVEEELLCYIKAVYERERDCLSSVFEPTTEGVLAGKLMALVRASVVHRYDYSIFGENPSLASPLLDMNENTTQ